MSFEYLRNLHVTEESEAEWVFESVPGKPSIIFAPMTDSNKTFLNDRVAASSERAQQLAGQSKADRSKTVTAFDILAEDRELDTRLLAYTCAKRWGTPPKEDGGKDAPFSADKVFEFLSLLPTHFLDPCRGFVSNPYNFVTADHRAAAELAIQAKTATDKGEQLGN